MAISIYRRAVICALFLLAPISTAGATDGDPVVARAVGVEIHQSDLAIAEEGIGPSTQQIKPDQRRVYLINYLVNMALLTKAAERQKLEDRPDVKRWLTFDHNRRLMLSLLQDTTRAAVSDQAEQQVYEDAVKQMKGEEEVHARHILVGTAEEAKAIVAQLKGGADFTMLAKQKSKDPTVAKNGGDLGYFTKDQMVPEFAKVAFTLDKGQISDPVQTQFGWHIIEVEDKRIKPTPTFAEMKPQLDAFIGRRARDQLIDNLRKSATIEMLDKPASSNSSANPASAEH